MKVLTRGENVEVTGAIEEYVERKISKLEKYFEESPAADAHVKISVYNDEQRIEVTIPMTNLLLRAEDSHVDLYAAIDQVVDKLERQIRKHKTKINRKFRKTGGAKLAFAEMEQDAIEAKEEEEPGNEIEIVRKKRFNIKPMDSEEAVLQMDMLGHNFFVFENRDSGETNVVYKRNDGKYGLIEPEVL